MDKKLKAKHSFSSVKELSNSNIYFTLSAWQAYNERKNIRCYKKK